VISEFSEKAYHRTAYDIDRQGAERKLDALAQLLNISAQEVAKDRSDEASCADQENGTQCATR
jgi:hypothetical protein